MIALAQFLWYCCCAYRRAKRNGKAQYFGIVYRGVPIACGYIATGREAWRVSQIATPEYEGPTP